MQQLDQLLKRQEERFNTTFESYPHAFTQLQHNAHLHAELQKLWIASDYAADVCCTNPWLFADLLQTGDLFVEYASWDQQLPEFIRRLPPELISGDPLTVLRQQLRYFRKREMLRIIWRDVNSDVALMDTCGDLSMLADVCVAYAIAQLTPVCQQAHGIPLDENGDEQQLIVLAMGKYGADELNMSSDIDLIFAFPESGETTVTPALKEKAPQAQVTSTQQYFCKLGQLLINMLDTVTSDGFVFRVDMRLRPYGSTGALALSIDAMEEYYQSQGRDWERFAMIKVRAVTGQAAAAKRLLGILRSFSFRRYLDFATIASLRDLKAQIEQQVRRKGMSANIKLGAGGIREIEFIVQVLQLIYGGKHPHLQQRRLLDALAELVQQECIGPGDADALRSSYLFLRKLEHAIQALEDKQTHNYPADVFSEFRIATSLGMKDAEELRTVLATVRKTVAGHFADLIAEPARGERAHTDPDLTFIWQGSLERDKALEVLTQKGFKPAEGVLETIDNYRKSRQVLAMEPAARERMDRFIPLLLARLTQEEDPALGFSRIFTFVQSVAQRTIYLVLLLENPLALSQLIKLCTASPWVVEQLSRHPALLDELLRPLSQPPARLELQDMLRQQLLRVASNELDEQLNSLQYFKQEQILTVAAAELSGTMPLMKISDYLTWLAEVILSYVLDLAWQQLTTKYGFPRNAAGESGAIDFIVIAYGKLGGIELNYGSDLDLVFMHDGHAEKDTTGGAAGLVINSSAFYVQLGQKILSLLNTQTHTGKLYEIDMRLRPSGASGTLVSSKESFSRYQKQDAWTWEHQALVRSRLIAGATALAEDFETIRREVLGKQRDHGKLVHDIVSMRQRMRKELGSKKPEATFHLKQDAGGLVDIEFIVQYLVLNDAWHCPQLLGFSDNMRLLDVAAAQHILPRVQAEQLQEVYIEYRTRLHRLALEKGSYLLPATDYFAERQAVLAIWDSLFATTLQEHKEPPGAA
ncbi:MAG: bifunctional [glutamate--ammonia ligase]-adenylyl-L-tyrosine phosphorylase/[glutamate--ammonia-ligase] adenylyltransferase [Pseudomonadota bacterium]